MTDAQRPASIEYRVYDASDAAPMVRLLGDVFSRYDPPAVAAGVTASEFEAFVQLFCPKAAVEELTVVAKLATTGELVGALLAEDGSSAPPDGMDELSESFGPIFEILGELDSEYRGDQEVRPLETLHLFLLGVSPQVAGQGVAQQLVTRCLEHGASRGYQLAVTEATNKVSQHIFRKQGFVERVRRSYLTHRYGGRAIFESIAEHGGPILMDKPIAR